MPILQLDNFIKLHKVDRLDRLDDSIREKLLTTPIAGTGAVSYERDYLFLKEYYSNQLPGPDAIGGTIPMIAEIQGEGMEPFLMSVLAIFEKGKRDAPVTQYGSYVVGMCPTAFDYKHYPAGFTIADHPEHAISSAEKVSWFYKNVDLGTVNESLSGSVYESFTADSDSRVITIKDSVMERAVQLTSAAGIKADKLAPAKHLVGTIPNWHEANNLLLNAGLTDKLVPAVEFILGFPGSNNPY